MVKEPPITREELAEADRVLARQPRTRAECPPADVPCPFVACRYHLWTVRTYHKGVVVAIREAPGFGDLEHTCVLHHADEGERTCEEVGAVLRISRQRAHQVERDAQVKMRAGLQGARTDRTDAPLSWESSGTSTPPWSSVSSSVLWMQALQDEHDRRAATAQTTNDKAYVGNLRRLMQRCEGLAPFVCPDCGTEAPPMTVKGKPRVACVDPTCRAKASRRVAPPSPWVLPPGGGL